MEEWRCLEEYPGYLVSSMGQIKTLNFNKTKQEKIIAQELSNVGYYTVRIYNKERQRKHINVHRLIAKSFLQPVDEKPLVDHINRNPKDNRLDNLRYVNKSENFKNSERYDTLTNGRQHQP